MNEPLYSEDEDAQDEPGLQSRAGANFQALTDDVLGPHYTVKRIRSQ